MSKFLTNQNLEKMKSKNTSFEGTTIFVGMDVHKKSWSVAPFTSETALKKYTVSPPSSKKLAESLRKQYPGAHFKCCYEAGFSGFWAQRELEVTKKIRELSRTKEYSKLSYLLQSVPGVSYLGSMILITELITIKRFKNLDYLCSYTGLVPDVNNSGEVERVLGITRRSNKRLRTFLIESAWIAIRQDPALSLVYTKYATEMKGQKAIVKIARKLLNRIRFVWLNETPYTRGIS